jgi:hypothetical protein
VNTASQRERLKFPTDPNLMRMAKEKMAFKGTPLLINKEIQV